jgi:hypothetical protein
MIFITRVLHVVSHMVFNDRQEGYPLCSQQLGLLLFPRLNSEFSYSESYGSCDNCLPLLHQYVIEL